MGFPHITALGAPDDARCVRLSPPCLCLVHEPIAATERVKGDTITSCVVVPTDERTAPRVQLTGPAKIALEMLARAVDEAGEKPPASSHIPPDISAVRASLWKRYCHAGSITTSDKPDSKDKAFKRASERLQNLGAVGVWDDWVWIIRT